jgi:hypothetical protein
MAESKEELEKQVKDPNLNPELREFARRRLAELKAPKDDKQQG